MTLEDIKSICLSLPGAALSVKWGDDQCYVVAEKMFAAHGAGGDEVSFKCSDDAFRMLTESGTAAPAKYLARAKWVSAKLDAFPKEEWRARLAAAYAEVRAKLPKKTQGALGPFDG